MSIESEKKLMKKVVLTAALTAVATSVGTAIILDRKRGGGLTPQLTPQSWNDPTLNEYLGLPAGENPFAGSLKIDNSQLP